MRLVRSCPAWVGLPSGWLRVANKHAPPGALARVMAIGLRGRR